MNIAFYLTLKKEVVYERHDATVRQVAEKMEHHRYTAIPILDEEGKYIGTVTEGDVLRALRNSGAQDFKEVEKQLISQLPLAKHYLPVRINARMEDLFDVVVHQNFVPVIDDLGIFIGIVKRSDIITSFQKYMIAEGSS